MWWLAQEARFAALPREVIFISNALRACPVFHQRAQTGPERPVVWDYHVVLALGREVWDLDCTLGAPLAGHEWLEASFGPGRFFAARYQPWFRVVDATAFAATFSSDRSHMRKPDGSFLREPPPWPCIGDGASNLMSFVDMTAPFLGEVVDLDELARRWR